MIGTYIIIYIYIFQLLFVFVFAGVAADDVFVFTDGWYQSVNFINNKKENMILERMPFA